MNDNNIFSYLIQKYHEKKLAHAFLLETNDIDKCYEDTLKFIEEISSNIQNIKELVENESLPSLITIRPDGQYIKKNQINEMMIKFNTKPVYTEYNIYIIINAEKFNSSSANTLLKFLEEPETDILGFFITNNRENVISTIRSRCQVFKVNYQEKESYIDEDKLLDVKIYLDNIYKNNEDILYNKTDMYNKYENRIDWEIFFTTMLYYIKDCLNNKRNDKIDMLLEINKENQINIIILIEECLKKIKYNGNIDLILDKFVIEMRNYYE